MMFKSNLSKKDLKMKRILMLPLAVMVALGASTAQARQFSCKVQGIGSKDPEKTVVIYSSPNSFQSVLLKNPTQSYEIGLSNHLTRPVRLIGNAQAEGLVSGEVVHYEISKTNPTGASETLAKGVIPPHSYAWLVGVVSIQCE
jgi:hypothetical protein